MAGGRENSNHGNNTSGSNTGGHGSAVGSS